MRVFQANRTADLVHKLMNTSDDLTLKQEVMLRTADLVHKLMNISDDQTLKEEVMIRTSEIL
jgi:hypothetical protein